MNTLKTLKVLGASLLILGSATAQDAEITPSPQEDTVVETSGVPDLEWFLETPMIMNVDSADAGLAPDFTALVEKVSLKTGTNTKLTLSCQVVREDGKLRDTRLNVGFDLDTEKQDFKRRMSIRRTSANVTIGDNKDSYRFQWNINTDSMVPFDRVLARRIFNAAVRGDTLKLEVSRKTRIDVTLPEMNDAFRTFAKGCPLL